MSQRKTDHIKMAALSAPSTSNSDERFYYEPLLAAHPNKISPHSFLGKEMKFPLWISSMTGGSVEANKINHLLAEASAEFGLGMGLGSCRSLLYSDEFFDDFNLRPIIGTALPFYANLGIAQIEQMIENGEVDKIHELIFKLQADGLFVHVNPTQEWLQPEGDRFKRPAIETIQELIDIVGDQYKLIVKEVGQGIGPESLSQLLKLKIDGIELGAFGGTNFASIEIMRNNGRIANFMYPLATIGHNADEMIAMINDICDDHEVNCKQVIVSGGIRNFLDGYYYSEKTNLPAVYGMAGVMLQHAMSSKEDLFDFIEAEKQGYMYASSFLKVR
ncbi:MAG: isopentenyl-diphosphate delta-isomerase [Prolixibacteraceae bacterium]|jgi:isopentenyl-diphosphate delta-isomerase|nr:isopentenyl-diphosphate delta-isomerase [Prolixibacteraceae bacterium]